MHAAEVTLAEDTIDSRTMPDPLGASEPCACNPEHTDQQRDESFRERSANTSHRANGNGSRSAPAASRKRRTTGSRQTNDLALMSNVPTRSSRSSKPSPSGCAFDRVAGVMMVSRAIGDAFLKRPEFSIPPFRAHVPYLSAVPEVSVKTLT